MLENISDFILQIKGILKAYRHSIIRVPHVYLWPYILIHNLVGQKTVISCQYDGVISQLCKGYLCLYIYLVERRAIQGVEMSFTELRYDSVILTAYDCLLITYEVIISELTKQWSKFVQSLPIRVHLVLWGTLMILCLHTGIISI